ncbi:MAG: hypothetical protein M3Y58_22805 [Chloroflexota bacterium]|nr:hypothetical protein [Chloroflexota bacterium]
MKTLWFKGIYVTPILSGAKTHTDRKANVWFEPGTTLDATVGPRPPFARLIVDHCERIPVSAFPPQEQEEMRAYVGDMATRVYFSLEIGAAR